VSAANTPRILSGSNKLKADARNRWRRMIGRAPQTGVSLVANYACSKPIFIRYSLGHIEKIIDLDGPSRKDFLRMLRPRSRRNTKELLPSGCRSRAVSSSGEQMIPHGRVQAGKNYGPAKGGRQIYFAPELTGCSRTADICDGGRRARTRTKHRGLSYAGSIFVRIRRFSSLRRSF